MKRHGNLWQPVISFEELLRAADTARRGKRCRPAVAAFHFDQERALWKLHEELTTKTDRETTVASSFTNPRSARSVPPRTRNLGQDLFKNCTGYQSSDTVNVAYRDSANPSTHGGTFAFESGSGMPLGVPRQQDMVIGEWVSKSAGNRGDFDQPGSADAFIRCDYDSRARLAHAVRVGNLCPHDLPSSQWACHLRSPLERLGFIVVEPRLRRRVFFDQPIPIQFPGDFKRSLPGHCVLQHFEILEWDNRSHIGPATANNYRLSFCDDSTNHIHVFLDVMRLIDVGRFSQVQHHDKFPQWRSWHYTVWPPESVRVSPTTQ